MTGKKLRNSHHASSVDHKSGCTQTELDSDPRDHILTKYLQDVRNLQNESAKTHRFAMLLGELYLDPHLTKSYTSSIEKRILRIDTGHGVKKGRADAYHGNAVIEFENSLKATGTHAKEQLREYVSGIWNSEPKRRALLAIATDGIVWQTYRPSIRGNEKTKVSAKDVHLELLREFTLSRNTFHEFWIWLTSLLYRPQQTRPTAEQFTIDFGSESPAYHDCATTLERAWQTIRESSEPQLAFETWKEYLTVTYGRLTALSKASNPKIREAEIEALFLKHTYLACVARFLVWASLSKGQGVGDLRKIVHDVLSGQFFESHNVANLVEDDFFQWVRRGEPANIMAPAWERVLSHLLTYDLSAIGEDVLKGIYQELIHPEDRHDLGEYYTPDWLCERIVTELLPATGFASVLDPACGSGSFLRATIKHYERTSSGVSEAALLQKILEHVVGIDIHPLAVTIARATYVLALGEHIHTAHRSIQIPVYLADSLFLPTEVRQLNIIDQLAGIELKFGGKTAVLPECLVHRPEIFDDAIAACTDIAADHSQQDKDTIKTMTASLDKTLPALTSLTLVEREQTMLGLWQFTEALAELIRIKKNSIWGFIVRNSYRPAMLRDRFEYVVGNPPWLSYRYISDPFYQQEVKKRAIEEYGIAPKSMKLMTHMEIATVFLAHCVTTFGKEGCQLGFVMPRSILSADQHANFRMRTYTAEFRLVQYWDLRNVEPLFQVPACVIFAVRDQSKGTDADILPAFEWFGKLPAKDIPWGRAVGHLQPIKRKGTVIRIGSRTAFSTSSGRNLPNKSSSYASRFHQGATILPRSFYFVQIDRPVREIRSTGLYWARTDPEQAKGAKPPYQDVQLEGQIEGRFVYLTCLSRHILPFAVLTPAIIVVPVEAQHGALSVRTAEQLQKAGYRKMAGWMRKVETIWHEKRKEKAAQQTVYERLDYQRELTTQILSHQHLVLYNAAGANVSAAYLDRGLLPLDFLVDHKLYWLPCASPDEAHFLVAILNSRAVNEAIKPFQSMGLLGERDIHKKVLDLPIPEYDSRVTLHTSLAEWGKTLREKAKGLIESRPLPATLAIQRALIRDSFQDDFQELDKLVSKLLELHFVPLY